DDSTVTEVMLALCVFIAIIYATSAIVYNIGTTAAKGSLAYENIRYGVERWNNDNFAYTEITLHIVATDLYYASFEELMCDVMQHSVVAVLIPPSDDLLDESLIKSMCHHFQVPCISMKMGNPLEFVSDYVTSVGPRRGSGAQATSEFLENLRWTSFLLAYQFDTDLEELAPLIYDRRSSHNGGVRASVKVRKLPNNTDDYEPFLKYVRNRLRQTNIVIHSNNITVIYALLQQAKGMNMTEPPFSYIFTNTDLSLLEDFLNNAYGAFHCNITGLQLVKNDPMMKTSLALISEAVWVIGTAVFKMKELRNPPRPSALLCDAQDSWVDGKRMNAAIRGLRGRRQLTGDVRFDGQGEREDLVYYGIGRINSQFLKLGNWTERTGWQFDGRYANKWEFDIDPDADDLAGLHLRVVVYLEEPFVTKNSDNQYEGFCIDLLKEMAAILKFNYTIIEVQDGSYGIEDESGRWNGIIGVLQRHEADVSISALTITYSRVEVVDFTLPFMHLGISILLARANDDSEKSSMFTFLEPLSFSVWLSLIGAYLSVSFIMYLLARFSPYEWYDIEKIDERDRSIENQKNQFSVLNSLWFAVGSLMQQGSDVIPRAAATRVVAVIWWMFTQILISSYTAQLAAFLTVERMTTPIESTADLASQQKIRYGTLKSGSTMDFFRESRIPIYERMWSIMESSSPTVFVNSSKEGIARVKAGNYAYMMESSMVEYYMERDCQLQSIGGLLDSKGYGIALPKGSPLRDILSRTVLQLQERTILEALKSKWWRDMREGPSCSPQAEKSRASPPQSVFGIFYVLVTGLIIALLLAFGEYCIESRHDSSRLKLTVLGKIRDWWIGLNCDKAEKARNKLRNMQLDTAGQELPNISSPETGDEQSFYIRSGMHRTRASSTISREGLRRLSRMLSANHEQLIHLQLKERDALS
ncbi:hypothetical protein V3C99_011423, partial [Haemonchus contortus]